jgi:anti-anti-sigma factor
MDRRFSSQIRLSDSAQSEGEARHTLKFLAELNYSSAWEVVEAVRDALSPKPGRISIDLADVPLIDSSGLRALLQAKKMCEDADAGFEIRAISDAAARVIVMSGLADTFGLSDALGVALPAKTKRRPDVRDQQWQVFEYVAQSDPSVIPDLREKATSAAREAGARGDTLCDIQIAVGEALTNAYRHGSPKKPENKINMRCMTCPKAAVIEITDEGDRFDFDNCSEPDPNQMRDHGMGIYLMRQAMDVVEFCCDCPGNRVRMIKWLK